MKNDFLGFERCSDDVFQTVIAHEMANKWGDDGPKNVGLEVLLEEPTEATARFIFFLGKGKWPRMDVGVFLDNVGVGVVLDVVFLTPIIHRQSREQWESEGCKRDVACFGFASG